MLSYYCNVGKNQQWTLFKGLLEEIGTDAAEYRLPVAAGGRESREFDGLCNSIHLFIQPGLFPLLPEFLPAQPIA